MAFAEWNLSYTRKLLLTGLVWIFKQPANPWWYIYSGRDPRREISTYQRLYVYILQ